MNGEVRIVKGRIPGSRQSTPSYFLTYSRFNRKNLSWFSVLGRSEFNFCTCGIYHGSWGSDTMEACLKIANTEEWSLKAAIRGGA